ncbi:MAG: hypothetical protein QXU40_01455 [Candidatus Pacearchaeota archaeon]
MGSILNEVSKLLDEKFGIVTGKVKFINIREDYFFLFIEYENIKVVEYYNNEGNLIFAQPV